jgi:hypothetical protein
MRLAAVRGSITSTMMITRTNYMATDWFDPSLTHSHKAVEDAMGHAVLFCFMVQSAQALRGSCTGA